jgi:subtilisin family serine protease
MHLRRSNLYCLPRRARWRRLLALLLAAVSLLAPWPAAPVQGQAPTSTAVMLEFDAPPTARIYAAALAADPVNGRASATRAAQAHLARLDAAQRELLPRLAQVDATVLYRTQRVYNGIALRIDRAHLAGLAQLPGVKAVHPLRPKTPDLTHSTPHIGGPALWAGLAGLPAVQGEGIRIGIIDTGIDYLHVDFGGPGVGYAQNDRRIIGDVVGFPSAKIAGGYDFVGETYNADPTAGGGG